VRAAKQLHDPSLSAQIRSQGSANPQVSELQRLGAAQRVTSQAQLDYLREQNESLQKILKEVE
jgi:hypothetical protein